MRILLTGGCGFIGSNLVEFLISKGEEVFVIDSLECGCLENLKKFENNKNFHFKKIDVVDLSNLEKFDTSFFGEKDEKFDQIYHLACPASPITYQKDPVKTLLTSVLGTNNLLNIAKINKCRILFSSTSEVYGDPLVHPQVENYLGNVNCTGIRSCYDEGKRAAESLCFDYNRTKKYGNVDIRIARIFNTYGPKMMIDDGRIVSNFIAQCLRKQPITIYGDGSQTRSFCFVSDMVNGLFSLMNQNNTIGPVNLGNPCEFTVKELANLVNDLICEGKNKIIYFDLPQDDPQKRKPNIEKAKKFLSWEPKIQLKEGLEMTIKDFKKRIEC